MKKHLFRVSSRSGSSGHRNDARAVSTFPLEPIGLNGPTNFAVFCGMSLVLVILAIEVLITLHGVSCHLVWPFEE